MFAEDAPVYHGGALLAVLKPLIERARDAQVPVIYVQHEDQREGDLLWPGGSGWAIHPAIQPLPGETVIRKFTPDSFQETRLQAELKRLGVKHLVIAGIQTEFCVDTTCRRAFSLGYKVTLVKDGHSTWDDKVLIAPQIIAHHNINLGGWFATVKPAMEIEFTR